MSDEDTKAELQKTSSNHIAIWRRETIAGVTTFFTMAYIVVVNPAILSTDGTGIAFAGALTATVLLCFSMTLLMGLYARLPFAVAPGMGLNAFFAYTVILGNQVPWPVALGMGFWAGVLFVILSATPVRNAVAKAIPPSLRTASAVGIGIFLTFIGLKGAGIVVSSPVTLVKLGHFDGKTLLSLGGLALSAVLLHRRSPLAFLAGIFAVTAAGGLLGWVRMPPHPLQMPDFSSVLLKLDPFGALKLVYLPTIIAILFTDLFDSLSTFVGVSEATGLVDDKGEPLRLKQGLMVDAWATLGAGLLGTSSGTAYIESAAGIEAGGRTGRTSVVTALCFLPCLFIAPLVGMVPAYAVAPVLILVGAMLFRSVTRLPMQRLEETLPPFLTVVLIPLTFSITQGMLWGFISHVLLFSLAGRRREVHPLMWGIAAISVGLLVLEQLAT